MTGFPQASQSTESVLSNTNNHRPFNHYTSFKLSISLIHFKFFFKSLFIYIAVVQAPRDKFNQGHLVKKTQGLTSSKRSKKTSLFKEINLEQDQGHIGWPTYWWWAEWRGGEREKRAKTKTSWALPHWPKHLFKLLYDQCLRTTL